MNFDKCREIKKDKIITVQENKRKYTIRNQSEVEISIIIVDGCLIEDNKEKCDFLFEINSISEVHYVELKGADIQKAYNQIVATVKACKNEHEVFLSKRGFIVASRVPKSGPQVQVLKKKMLKDCSTQLFVATNRHTEKIS